MKTEPQNYRLKLRDLIAIESMKIILEKQGERRLSIIDRIKFWLGINGWRVNFDYNLNQTAERAYEMAELMIKERSK